MSKVVPIRLTDELFKRYERQAAEQLPDPLPLSTYLKRKLEQGDNVTEELADLRRSIDVLSEQIPTLAQHGSAEQAGTPTNPAILIETLLLLRTVVGPDKLRAVHNELKRLGLSPWDGK